METKDYKSIYIHNGCRNPKMTVVHEVPKRTWKSCAIHVLKMYRGKYILRVSYLIDVNESLKDAEMQKIVFIWSGIFKYNRIGLFKFKNRFKRFTNFISSKNN